MKKALLLLFYCLLFTVHSSSAQKIRFTDTSNRWLQSHSYPGFCEYKWSSYWGYNQVNGITYLSIDGFRLYREDSALQRVYTKNNYLVGDDTMEHVLYDYSLAMGDTFISIHTYASFRSDTFIHIVSKIDSTLIDTVWHKVWKFKNIYSNISSSFFCPDYYVIEGIGCTYGINFPLKPAEFEGGYRLVCFSNNNKRPTINPTIGFFDNSQSCKLSVPTTTQENKRSAISPNPANENSVIKLPYKLQSGMLVIINTVGQAVSQKEIQNKEQVILGTLPVQGLYIYRVTDKQSNQSFTGKFVYE